MTILAPTLNQQATQPDIVFLDINLPKKNGRQVLHEIKSDPELRSIPLIILTTPYAERDLNETYMHHANCYITKPLYLNEFVDVVEEGVVTCSKLFGCHN